MLFAVKMASSGWLESLHIIRDFGFVFLGIKHKLPGILHCNNDGGILGGALKGAAYLLHRSVKKVGVVVAIIVGGLDLLRCNAFNRRINAVSRIGFPSGF